MYKNLATLRTITDDEFYAMPFDDRLGWVHLPDEQDDADADKVPLDWSVYPEDDADLDTNTQDDVAPDFGGFDGGDGGGGGASGDW